MGNKVMFKEHDTTFSGKERLIGKRKRKVHRKIRAARYDLLMLF